MGLIDRIRRITTASIESFLSSVEDPEVLFPQLIREMEDQVRVATEAEAKAMAAVKAAERETEQVQDKLDRMTKGAELAVKEGEEQTARDAVSAQIDLERTLATKQDALARAQATYGDAKQAREQVQAQLEELRVKKDEILTRSRVAKNQQNVEKTVSGPASSTGSILDSVARLEAQVEEAEAGLEVRREMSAGESGGPSLEKRLDDLEKNTEVDKRLAALKAKAE